MELFDDPPAGSNAPEFTVSEISGAVKRAIEGQFGRVRVRGEIGRVSRPASGHVYLDLKDDRSVLGSVIWKGAARALAVQPEDGMEVVATGRLTTFPGASKYQMVIEDLAPAGVGALMAMLEKRRAMLAAEGLFDSARKRPIPFLPEVIGVITSPSGAVIRDILHRLRERFPRPVLLWPVPVQGEKCAAAVAAAIRGFNDLPETGPLRRPDVLIVARGGGSLEDLWGFNEEAVVRAAAESQIPLISAVGHETDTTLIDHAADLRAPTPTAAAEMAVPVRLDLLATLAGLEQRRQGAMARGVAQRGQRLRDLARALPRPDSLVAERAQRLDALGLRLPRALTGVARDRRLKLREGLAGRFGPALLAAGNASRRHRLMGVDFRLIAAGSRPLGDRMARLAALAGRLRPGLLHLARQAERLEARGGRLDGAGARRLRAERARLEALARTLATLGPDSALARGFVLVRDGAGAVLTRAEMAEAAARLELEFADGRVKVRPERRAAGRPATGGPKGQGSLF